MKFLAIIPARYSSTRFPGKPLAEIKGKPMVIRVVERAKYVFRDNTYVATDDDRIYDIVHEWGYNAVLTSSEHKSGTDRCREALDIIERKTTERYDVVVNIQGDEPFVSVSGLEDIRKCFDDPKTDIATLVKHFAAGEDIFNPNSPKVVTTLDGFAIYFSRSVIPYVRGEVECRWPNHHKHLKHVGLYAYRSETLRKITSLPQSPLEILESLEQLRWIENGFTIKVALNNSDSYGIDTPEDLEKVLMLIESGEIAI